ncbi:MAG: hypothetical protein PVF43_11815 [Candidatus Eiseniibacteriota bacterium]
MRRRTRGTDVEIELRLDGGGGSEITTQFECLDSLLMMMAGHGGMDLRLTQRVNEHADASYAIDDLAMALAEAIRRSLGARARIRQFGSEILPVGDALVLVAVDLVSPPVFELDANLKGPKIDDLPVDLLYGFLDRFVDRLGASVHIKMLAGQHDLNQARAIFLALGRAIAMAAAPADRAGAREVAADIDYLDGERGTGDTAAPRADRSWSSDTENLDEALDEADDSVASTDDARGTDEGGRSKRRRGRRGGRGRRRAEGDGDGRGAAGRGGRRNADGAAGDDSGSLAATAGDDDDAGGEELEGSPTRDRSARSGAGGAYASVDGDSEGSGGDGRERDAEQRPRGRRRRGSRGGRLADGEASGADDAAGAAAGERSGTPNASADDHPGQGDEVEAWDPGTLTRATINHSGSYEDEGDDDGGEASGERPERHGRGRRGRGRRGAGATTADATAAEPRERPGDDAAADGNGGPDDGVIDYVTSAQGAAPASPARPARAGRRPPRGGRRRR